MIQLVEKLSEDVLQYLHDIYMQSFPPEERRPWAQIIAPTDARGPILRGIANQQGEVVGLITYWHLPTALYIEHLAIDPQLRGEGIGTELLKQLLAEAEAPVILEIEPSNLSPLAEARLRFYLRAGFSVVDNEYTQPPYSSALPSVNLWLMSSDPTINPAVATAELHSIVYRCQQ